MYRITTISGEMLGYTDHIQYIRVSDNGSYIFCEQPLAQGIAYNGNPYNIGDHDEIDGETVEISEEEFGHFVTMITANAARLLQDQARLDYLAMMTGIELYSDDEDADPDEEESTPEIDQEAVNNG